MRLVPETLSFVENRDVLDFGISVLLVPDELRRIDLEFAVHDGHLELGEGIVPVVVDDLDEALHFPTGSRQGIPVPGGPLLADFVAGQRLRQNGDQRTVPAQVHGRLFLLELLHCHVEADKRLSGARNAGHEANALLPVFAGVVDHAENEIRRRLEVFAGVAPRDVLDVVVRIQRARRLDDRRRRRVPAAGPSQTVDFASGHASESEIDRIFQGGCVGAQGNVHLCVVIARSEFERFVRRVRGDQNRGDDQIAARFVEVFQVERIVPHLFPVRGFESFGSRLELQAQNGSLDEKNHVDALPQSGNRVFEENPSFDSDEDRLKKANFFHPCIRLVAGRVESVGRTQLSQNRAFAFLQESGDCRSVVKPFHGASLNHRENT